MLDWIKTHKTLIVFIVFFLLVLIEHQFLWLYHDDYGYASLSYLGGFQPQESIGFHTTFQEIFGFLSFHYQNWGGRILYFLIECVLLKFGLESFRIVQSIVITGIFFLIYKMIVALTKKTDWKIALFTVLLYGVFEVMIVRSGIFWITASVLYLFPLLPFFGFVYWYVIKKEPQKRKWFFYLGNAFLLFIATFSQEQVSVLALGFIILYTLYDWYQEKRLSRKNSLLCLVGFVGFAILMIAPGNSIRALHPTSAAFYSLPLINKIANNTASIVTNNFGTDTRIFTLLFLGVACYLSYLVFKKKWGLSKLNWISLISSGTIFAFSLYKSESYFGYFYHLSSQCWWHALMLVIFVLQLALILYSMTVYLLKKNQPILLELFYAAIASQGAMLMAPYFPLRSALIFEIVMFIIFVYLFTDGYQTLKNKNQIYYFLVPVALILLSNFLLVTKGYARNDQTNRENHQKLLEVSEKIEAGEVVEKVKLSVLPDITYSAEQPYMEGCDYILIWMKKYYHLPQEIEIIYE